MTVLLAAGSPLLGNDGAGSQTSPQFSLTITIGTGTLDNIVITQPVFNSEKHELFVAANDPNTDVTVKVTLPGAGQPGQLHTFGDGNYNATFYLSSSINPTTVTVKSSRGASATSPVFFYQATNLGTPDCGVASERDLKSPGERLR